MSKLTRDFFSNGEVLFIGLSSNPKNFSREVYKDFINAGIKVFPINSKRFREDGLEVYSDISQLDHVPACAYIILNRENTAKAVQSLKGTPVKKIMFQSKQTVDDSTLEECRKMGIEAVVACPRMILNKGFMHRLHGFFAGVR